MLVLLAAGAGLAAQPGGSAGGSRLGERSNEYSYRGALGALWNYQSCGVRARAADYRALAGELQSIESLARSKGLGPTLERVREEYDGEVSRVPYSATYRWRNGLWRMIALRMALQARPVR